MGGSVHGETRDAKECQPFQKCVESRERHGDGGPQSAGKKKNAAAALKREREDAN